MGTQGQQVSKKTNTNGKKILKLTEELDLNILNLDPRCEGEATWGRGEQSSTIDFLLANKNMTEKFEKMTIDEDQKTFDLSDHNLITAHFRTEQHRWNKEETKQESYECYKTDKESMNKYTANLEQKINKAIEEICGKST